MFHNDVLMKDFLFGHQDSMHENSQLYNGASTSPANHLTATKKRFSLLHFSEKDKESLLKQNENDLISFDNQHTELLKCDHNKGDACFCARDMRTNNKHKSNKKVLHIVQLKPISINSEVVQPQVINLRQTFNFPFSEKKLIDNVVTEISTQTSSTLLMKIKSNPSLEPNPSFTKPNLQNIRHSINKIRPHNVMKSSDILRPPLKLGISRQRRSTPAYHCRSCKYPGRPTSKLFKNLKSREMDRNSSADIISIFEEIYATGQKTTDSTMKAVESTTRTIDGCTPSVSTMQLSDKINEDNFCNVNNNDKNTIHDESSDVSIPTRYLENDAISSKLDDVVEKLQDCSWEKALEAVHELKELIPSVDWAKNEKHKSVINRKLIDFLRSPRTTLCRTSCQAISDMFAYAQNVKQPEFNDIVHLLLCKTADQNRFIQKDANIALDKMVTYMPIFHSVRVLCSTGPTHKNPLVRIATARLLVCIVALAGPDNIIGIAANPTTRKRVLSSLVKFLVDKSYDTRKFGERLCKMLKRHKYFNEYFYKDLENNKRNQLKKIVNAIN